MAKRYDISVVISTYNRSELLPAAIESILDQDARDLSYEILIVDNNSTDATKAVIDRYSIDHPNLEYLREPRQGVSYARNCGIAHAKAQVIAFFDDDVRVARDWLTNIKRYFDSHPEADCIGGRVLPRWESPAPAWLNRDQWMPLGVQDYGDKELVIDNTNRLCLVSGNLACRSSMFREIGTFAVELQRVKDGIGSLEDAEMMERCWRFGRRCVYLPDLMATTEVPFARMTKKYHRRWHIGHGRFYSKMRSEELENCTRRLLDVPAYLYRQTFLDSLRWFRCMLSGESAQAFAYETQIRFFLGFFWERQMSKRAVVRSEASGIRAEW
jgi:glucosyl-dolichyl phosphate glucuronosyltransferase